MKNALLVLLVLLVGVVAVAGGILGHLLVAGSGLDPTLKALDDWYVTEINTQLLDSHDEEVRAGTKWVVGQQVPQIEPPRLVTNLEDLRARAAEISLRVDGRDLHRALRWHAWRKSEK